MVVAVICVPALCLCGAQDLDPTPVRGSVPLMVQPGDLHIPSIADDVDDLRLRIYLLDLLHEIDAWEEGRLVANDPLAALCEPPLEEVVDDRVGHAGEE